MIRRGKKEILEKLENKDSAEISFKNYGDRKHYLYLFGHSLDVTDKDIHKDSI